MSAVQWWGYRHTDGTCHVKRLFTREAITEAMDSPLVTAVYGPWEVQGWEEAIARLKQAVETEWRQTQGPQG